MGQILLGFQKRPEVGPRDSLTAHSPQLRSSQMGPGPSLGIKAELSPSSGASLTLLLPASDSTVAELGAGGDGGRRRRSRWRRPVEHRDRPHREPSQGGDASHWLTPPSHPSPYTPARIFACRIARLASFLLFSSKAPEGFRFAFYSVFAAPRIGFDRVVGLRACCVRAPAGVVVDRMLLGWITCSSWSDWWWWWGSCYMAFWAAWFEGLVVLGFEAPAPFPGRLEHTLSSIVLL